MPQQCGNEEDKALVDFPAQGDTPRGRILVLEKARMAGSSPVTACCPGSSGTCAKLLVGQEPGPEQSEKSRRTVEACSRSLVPAPPGRAPGGNTGVDEHGAHLILIQSTSVQSRCRGNSTATQRTRTRKWFDSTQPRHHPGPVRARILLPETPVGSGNVIWRHHSTSSTYSGCW